MANRRSVLIGLGGLVAGGGALVGTGAFDTVTAERTVSVETAGDANALLGLSPADRGDGDNAYVEQNDGTIEINLDGNDEGADGLNQNAITTFRNLVQVTNQGTQTVESITLQFIESPGDVTPSDTFSFPVDDDGSQDTANHPSSGGAEILTGNNVSSSLDSGSSINFGLEVDLIDGGNNNDLPDGGSYTLQISAESADN